MFYNPSIHPISLLAKDLLGRIEKMRGGLVYEKNELLVLNYHSTPKKFIPQFKEQVDFLSEHFNILNPADLGSYFSDTYKTNRCSVLFTFDDGLKNNWRAAEVLEGKNAKALFFVVPAFINTAPAEQKQFYLKNIRPTINTRIDNEAEDFCALTWSELEELIKKGHSVGAHTHTHTLVAEHSTSENSEKEILEGKKIIEDRLGIPVGSFCSINDTLLSTEKKEKALIEGHFFFHFTTLPGYNAARKDPHFIKRRNVECFWPSGAFYYALGRSDLKRWENKILKYESL